MNPMHVITHIVYSDMQRLKSTCDKRRYIDYWCNIDDAIQEAIIRTAKQVSGREARWSPERIYDEFTRQFYGAHKSLSRDDTRVGIVVGKGRTGMPPVTSAVRDIDWSILDCDYERDLYDDSDELRIESARHLLSVLEEMKPGITKAGFKAVSETTTHPGVGAGIARELGISPMTAWRLLEKYRDYVKSDPFLTHLLKIVLGEENAA